jgi:TPP-dependent pyruvate/acetoin dehydrogenase alpha subunit
VDGNDPIAMYAAARKAIVQARTGQGPTLIEAMTFRFHGHVFGDADAYMDPEVKRTAMAADPYPRFRADLLASRVASEAQLAAIERECEAQIDSAVDFALASPFPDLAEIHRDVYAQELIE